MAIYHKGQRMDGGGSGGMTEDEADQRYLQLIGGTLSGPLEASNVSIENLFLGKDPATNNSIAYMVVTPAVDGRYPMPEMLQIKMRQKIVLAIAQTDTSWEIQPVVPVNMSGRAIQDLPENPSGDHDAVCKSYVDAAIAANSGVPSGCIMFWNGSENTIPDGWVLCDGNNGTTELILYDPTGLPIYGIMKL